MRFWAGVIPAGLLLLAACGASVAPEQTLALFTAARRGTMDSLEGALRAGVRPNEREPFRNRTALMVAASYGQLAVVERLLQAGADANAEDYAGITPLWEAADAGEVAVAKRLIQAGAKVDIAGERHGRASTRRQPPLFRAIAGRHAEMIPVLLQAGADPAVVDNGGYRAVDVAVELRWAEGVRRMLATKKAEAYAPRYVNRQTPLHDAMEKCDEALPALVDAFADGAPELLQARTADGVSPLGFARKWATKDIPARECYARIAAHLESRGARE